MAHSAAHDAWDSQFPVDSAFLPSISALQEHCASYAQQLVQPTTPPATAIKPKAFPQLQLLRSTSPALSARRNASLRNLASLARGSPTSPRLAPTPLNSAEPTSGIDRRTAPSTAAATTAVPATATTVRSEQGSPVVSDEYVGKPIASTAQFLEWYSAVEEQLAAGQDQEAHAFAELLRDRSQKCSAMLQAIGDVRRMLAMMHDNYQRVCAQTEGVKGACQELQHRRDRLEHAQTQINATLRIYNSLPPIAQLFNAPGDRVCLDPEFLPSLERCEQAMEFLGEHGSAQDSELYLMRFAQCRVRALTLIKMHALRVFKTLAGEMARESAQSLSTNTLYMRFRATGRGLAPLARALHERAIGSGDGSDGKTPAASATGTGTERQMWADVVAAYFHVRRTWLRPYIKNSMDRIASECAQAAADADADANTSAGDGSQGVRVDALRDWCAFVMGLCADEFRLYYEFFDAPSEHGASMPPELRAYLDAIMAVFYEHVRPLVIHESDVHVLAGLSLTLLTYHRSSALAMAEYDHMDVGDDDMPRDSFAVAEEENGLDAFYAV
ncbi:Golgi transport complex subunit 3, partial [Linderina macrospora]